MKKCLVFVFFVLFATITIVSCAPSRAANPTTQKLTVTSTFTSISPPGLNNITSTIAPTITTSSEIIPQPVIQGRAIISIQGKGVGVLDFAKMTQTKFVVLSNEQIADNHINHALSSDRRFFAFVVNHHSETEKPAIIIINLDTNAVRTIPFLDYDTGFLMPELERDLPDWVDWSPDSRKLTYIYRQALFVYDVETNTTAQVYQGPGAGYNNIRSLITNPDPRAVGEYLGIFYGRLLYAKWISNDCILVRSFEGSMPDTITFKDGNIPELETNRTTLVCYRPSMIVSHTIELYWKADVINYDADHTLILETVNNENEEEAWLTQPFVDIQNIDHRMLPEDMTWNQDLYPIYVIRGGMLIVYKTPETDPPIVSSVDIVSVDLETLSPVASDCFIFPQGWGNVQEYWPVPQIDEHGPNLSTVLFTAGIDNLISISAILITVA